MPGAETASLPSGLTAWPDLAGRIPVGPVMLLGERVIALARLRAGEHERRRRLGLGPVTDPGLLDALLNLPGGVPVADLALWAETAHLPDGIVDRDGAMFTVTRLLEPPIVIDAVAVPEMGRRELRAVQRASWFAGFTRRWVVTGRSRIPDAAILEAKLCGVGLVGPGGRVVIPAEPPTSHVFDGWAWGLREKAYRWLCDNPGRAVACPASAWPGQPGP